jgi:hypothetical protein
MRPDAARCDGQSAFCRVYGFRVADTMWIQTNDACTGSSSAHFDADGAFIFDEVTVDTRSFYY